MQLVLHKLINLSVACFLLNLNRSTTFSAFEKDRETHHFVNKACDVRWYSHLNIKILAKHVCSIVLGRVDLKSVGIYTIMIYNLIKCGITDYEIYFYSFWSGREQNLAFKFSSKPKEIHEGRKKDFKE